MEKSILKIIAWGLCFGIPSINAQAEQKKYELILVTSQNSYIYSISPLEIRKLFLGVPVIRNGQPVQPLYNDSDPLLLQVFLQKIIFMSSHSYERELLSRVYRTGGKLPKKFATNTELANKLRDLPGSLTYMWAGTLEQTFGLKSLGVIWSGPSH